MIKNAKIYIAGHRGLVGSAILNNLRSKGYTNFITKTHNELDLTNQQSVADFFEKEKPAYVFLAAAKVGGIVANNTYRADFMYANLMIQNNVIHQSYVHNVKKLLFLGSSCVYPKNSPQPIKEEYLLTDTLEYTNEPYAIAKIAGIKMCESYNIQYGTNFIAVQPTNLYGPHDNFDLEKSHVLPALIRKIHLGKALEENNWELIRKDFKKLPIEGVDESSSEADVLNVLAKYGVRHSSQDVILSDSRRISPSEIENNNSGVEVEIWGSGKPTREFLWSEDMADACVHLMENVNFKDIVEENRHSERNGSEVKESVKLNHEIRNTHINIGTGKDISINELAQTIKKIIGFNGHLFFNTIKPDGTMRKLTDSSKLHHLGWKHSLELEEGIKNVYNWYLSND